MKKMVCRRVIWQMKRKQKKMEMTMRERMKEEILVAKKMKIRRNSKKKKMILKMISNYLTLLGLCTRTNQEKKIYHARTSWHSINSMGKHTS